MCGIADACECVFVEIDKEYFHKEKNIIMGVIYRPPGTGMDICKEHMSSLLNALRWKQVLLLDGRL